MRSACVLNSHAELASHQPQARVANSARRPSVFTVELLASFARRIRTHPWPLTRLGIAKHTSTRNKFGTCKGLRAEFARKGCKAQEFAIPRNPRGFLCTRAKLAWHAWQGTLGNKLGCLGCFAPSTCQGTQATAPLRANSGPRVVRICAKLASDACEFSTCQGTQGLLCTCFATLAWCLLRTQACFALLAKRCLQSNPWVPWHVQRDAEFAPCLVVGGCFAPRAKGFREEIET